MRRRLNLRPSLPSNNPIHFVVRGGHGFCSVLRAGPTSANHRLNTVKNMTLSTRGEMREVYSVDGTRVTLEGDYGWQCECAAHSAGLQCAHVARAAVFKQMRGVRRESDDTIELTL